ncbi:MAG: CO dehydrogenase/CO-methylating acetyl-CoA synthase complex subunit beta [Chloroflexota bacterium]
MQAEKTMTRVYQLPLELERLYDGLDDLGIGPRYISHIRKGEWHVELGGPKHEYKSFILAEVKDKAEDVQDGRVELIGPDLQEIEPESSFPFGIQLKAYGPELNVDHTEFLERGTLLGLLFLEGWMLVGARSNVWVRVKKKVIPRSSFVKLAQCIRASVLSMCPIAEAVEVRIVIGAPEVGGQELVDKHLKEANEYWEAVDARHKGLSDEDVDTFYGCTICKMIAPNHACIITPSTLPYCGIMSFYSAKAIYDIDPSGYVFEVPVGDVLDSRMGWYSGVDETIWEKSGHRHKHFYLHTTIKYPTTNCGCFEAASFYIPEVDGVGLAQRRYFGPTPIGIPFSKIAGMMSGGAQNHGFKGISVLTIRSPKFLQGDGAWDRIVWMPKTLKLEVADVVPEEVYDKIATEEDCIDTAELKDFLIKKKHPIVEKFWKNGEPHPLEVPLPGEDWPNAE